MARPGLRFLARSGTRPPASLSQRLRAEWLTLTTALVLLAIGLSVWDRAPGIRELNWIAYDLSMQTAAQAPPRSDIVIIAIDDASLEALGFWPWPRALHAQLLGRLGQARAVGLDLIFADPHPFHPEDDPLLAQAIAAHGRVVLPVVLDPASRHVIAPIEPLARAAAAIGRIDVQPDADGTLRSVQLHRSTTDGTVLPHFSLALDQVARQSGSPQATTPPTARTQAATPPTASWLKAAAQIQFTDPASAYTLLPYHAVLEGKVPESSFRDRIVLVGAWASGLGDHLATSISGELMPGVGVLANSVQNLQDGLWIRTPPAWRVALAALVPIVLVALGLRRLSPRRSLLLAIAVLAAFMGLDVLLMRAAHYWVPPAGILLALALAYPLWSWRSQEASLKHIDAELERLRVRPLPEALPAVAHDGPDTLPARVVRLQQAVTQLRQAARLQEETLGFISHDMRSPQSAILAAVALRRSIPVQWSEADTLAQIERQVHVTLRLVDQFVQLARAESAPLNRQPCHLGDLLQDCCDRHWAQAKQAGIELRPAVPDADCMVVIDADLVARAIGNLLHNAILHTPPGGSIDCRLAADGPWWHIHVQDTGPGIPAAQIGQLFNRYWRPADPAGQGPAGTGLGLPFVQVVAQRHGGQAACTSPPGQGASFTISLPAKH